MIQIFAGRPAVPPGTIETATTHNRADKRETAVGRYSWAKIQPQDPMISFDKKCIFVHIPKTGGTSIENAIWGPDWSRRTVEQLWMGIVRPGFNKYQTGGLQHLLASQIRQEVAEEMFRQYFKFAFVRNPWDKAVSQFHYVKKLPTLLKYLGLTRWSSFRRYVKVISVKHHFQVQSYEQWRFIYDESGQQLVDFVGRFENLNADFQQVARKIGLNCGPLPHDMKSVKRKHYTQYYSKESVRLIAKTYAKDIELFGYVFGQ